MLSPISSPSCPLLVDVGEDMLPEEVVGLLTRPQGGIEWWNNVATLTGLPPALRSSPVYDVVFLSFLEGNDYLPKMGVFHLESALKLYMVAPFLFLLSLHLSSVMFLLPLFHVISLCIHPPPRQRHCGRLRLLTITDLGAPNCSIRVNMDHLAEFLKLLSQRARRNAHLFRQEVNSEGMLTLRCRLMCSPMGEGWAEDLKVPFLLCNGPQHVHHCTRM